MSWNSSKGPFKYQLSPHERGGLSVCLCGPKRLYYREPFLIFSVLAERDLRFGVVQGDGNFFPPIFLQKAGL